MTTSSNYVADYSPMFLG